MSNLKETLIVPKGIRFISEWAEFDLPKLEEKCIINKKIPGCGMTEYYLTNSYNVILASPRKILLQNKFDQHPNDVFLVKNEEEKEVEVDRELDKNGGVLDNISNTVSSSLYQRIRKELSEYISRRTFELKPIKVLVTYDSYHIIKDILRDFKIFDTFYTMVDEFQCILSDSKFKSNTEISVMNSLRDVSKVHFVSATPMIDDYLGMLKDFNTLKYYIFDWISEDEFRVLKPNLKVRAMSSVGTSITSIIQKYKSGEFDKVSIFIDDKVKEIVSDEAIFYVNSVGHIVSAIKKNSLTADQVNILCSDTDYNKKRLKDKLGKSFVIGSVPLKGEKPKMFTFCTRTVYLGADFYSKCARTFVFSDSNYDCLAVDISQDLPQILGRQRNIENPWRNSADFYYKSTANWKLMTKEDFDSIIKDKIDRSNDLLAVYEKGSESEKISLSDKYKQTADLKHYEIDYVAVNNGVPVFNDLYYVSELMAFDIQQVDYADRFSVFSKINKDFSSDHLIHLEKLLEDYKSLNNVISKRLQFICELHFSKNPNLQNFLDILPNDDYAKSYYYRLGPDRCRAKGYIINDVRQEISVKEFDQKLLREEVYKHFHEGDKKTREEIKTILASIYSSLGYQRNAKATDIEEYFEIIKTNMKDKTTGKTINLLKLNKRKG